MPYDVRLHKSGVQLSAYQTYDMAFVFNLKTDNF